MPRQPKPSKPFWPPPPMRWRVTLDDGEIIEITASYCTTLSGDLCFRDIYDRNTVSIPGGKWTWCEPIDPVILRPPNPEPIE